jgi:tetratricopeptide (TPR) repeat protein
MAAQRADLPMAAQRADLPMAAQRADLPMAAQRADLPAPAPRPQARPPRPVDDDLPLVLDVGLPSLAESNLPVAVDALLPVPADQDLPIPSPLADLPLPADQDLPLPSPTGDLPLPADFNLPTRVGTSADDEIPLGGDDFEPIGRSTPWGSAGAGAPVDERVSAPLPLPPEGADWDAAGARRGAAPDAAARPRDDAAFLDQGVFPRSVSPPSGDSDLPQAKPSPDAAAPAPAAPVRGRVPDDRRRKRRSLRVALVGVPLVAIAGGLLMFTSYGHYGYHFFSDTLNKSEQEQAFASFRESAQTQLEADTAGEARAVFAEAQRVQATMPRFIPQGAYTAYLAFYSVVRFGGNSSQLAAGQQLVSTLAARGESPNLALAQAAMEAATKSYAPARSKLLEVLDQMPDDLDALVLAAEVELLAGDAKAARGLWSKAVAQRKSARTLYGLARAEHALGQREAARKHADEVLRLSKHHAGARALVATLLFEVQRKSSEPLPLLQQIVDEGPVRQAASTEELVAAYSLLGTIQLAQGQPGAAEKSFKAALGLDPQSAHALVGSAEVFYQSGRYTEALAGFDAAQRVDRRDVRAAVGVAKTKLALESIKEARELLVQLGKQHRHPLVGYWLGQAHEAAGDRAAAEKSYRAAIALETMGEGMVESYVALASLLGALGKQAEADKILEQASEKLPDNSELHVTKGSVALKSGRLTSAKEEFTKALAIDAEDLRPRFGLATAHRRAREFNEAQEALDVIAKSDPEYPGLALERGLLYEAMGELAKALGAYDDALKKAPDDVDLKLRVGSTQVISGQPDQALPLLREVLKARPRSAEVNHFLGRALLLIGDSPHEALRFLELAVQLDANRPEYHLFLAWAANETGKIALAEQAVNKALELDQNLGDGYWQRAALKQKRGQALDALEDLKLALEKNPSRHEAYATMALCYQDQANYASAEDAWRRAIAGNDRVPEWHFRLAKILIDRGARDAALPHLERTVTLVRERKLKPLWLWNAQLLLGDALRDKDPKRALEAYQAFLRLTDENNAYREDAIRAVEELKKKPAP